MHAVLPRYESRLAGVRLAGVDDVVDRYVNVAAGILCGAGTTALLASGVGIIAGVIAAGGCVFARGKVIDFVKANFGSIPLLRDKVPELVNEVYLSRYGRPADSGTLSRILAELRERDYSSVGNIKNVTLAEQFSPGYEIEKSLSGQIDGVLVSSVGAAAVVSRLDALRLQAATSRDLSDAQKARLLGKLEPKIAQATAFAQREREQANRATQATRRPPPTLSTRQRQTAKSDTPMIAAIVAVGLVALALAASPIGRRR